MNTFYKIFKKMFNFGDNVICKHSFSLQSQKFHSNQRFIEGGIYRLNEKNILDIRKNRKTEWDYYFITVKELRKQKLKKINESNL